MNDDHIIVLNIEISKYNEYVICNYIMIRIYYIYTYGSQMIIGGNGNRTFFVFDGKELCLNHRVILLYGLNQGIVILANTDYARPENAVK